MILVDTGPLVALFDPRDSEHDRCRRILTTVREPLVTTVPVLVETFYMLRSGSRGSNNVRDFVMQGGMSVWFMDSTALQRAFELMETYADHPMDMADASMVVAAEMLVTRSVFTIDRRDFDTYRVRHGHRHYPLEIVT